ncbi:MAG: transposase [Gammaproteobacteria bacterium]
MPRRARLAIAGIPWHIIQRGNKRSACFYHEEDYRFYLAQLELQAMKFGCHAHAYCLMTNHVHLLVTPVKKESASLMMKNLGQRFVQYINKSYRRSGTLWEGRFKSCITQEERYVLTCYRYIELNPVRAGMVSQPQDYLWSSYKFNAHGQPDSCITPHRLYLSLAASQENRLAAYCALVENGMNEKDIKAIRSATKGNFVLGNNRFQRQIGNALGQRTQPGRPGRPPKESD